MLLFSPYMWIHQGDKVTACLLSDRGVGKAALVHRRFFVFMDTHTLQAHESSNPSFLE